MSKENLAIARSFFPGRVDLVALFGDPEVMKALEPLVQPGFEAVFETGLIPMGDRDVFSESGQLTTHGIEGLVAVWRDWLSAWASWVITPSEFIDVDDERVLILMSVRARSKTHQVEIPIEGANLLTLRDEKLARLELFLNRDEALEAAGLSE